MVALVQRVSEASVIIKNETKSAINRGMLVLLGIENNDGEEDIDWLVNKLAKLRIFDDENGVMNKSVQDIDGEILVISQFTLHARTKKGNRPSYIDAAKPDIAVPLYNSFVAKMNTYVGKEVQTGEFGADMDVSLTNKGPVTIHIDTKNKK